MDTDMQAGNFTVHLKPQTPINQSNSVDLTNENRIEASF